MSAYPDNVIVLDDYRHNLPEYSYEPFELRPPARPDLRLITGPDTPSEPFGLEVFLRRAMIVMAVAASGSRRPGGAADPAARPGICLSRVSVPGAALDSI